MLVGSNNRYVIPVSISLSAGFMVLIDTMSCSISIIEPLISIRTAIVGASVFTSTLKRNQSNLR